MNSPSQSHTLAALTTYRFRRNGAEKVSERSVSQLTSKQWSRFADQVAQAREGIFWQSYQRFCADLVLLSNSASDDIVAITELTQEMARLKTTLRMVREACYARLSKTWMKKHGVADIEELKRAARAKVGEAAIECLAGLSAEQKKILAAPNRTNEVAAIRSKVTWCDRAVLRQAERAFRRRIGNTMAFIDVMPAQIEAVASGKTELPTEPIQLHDRSGPGHMEDSDIIAFLEEDDDDAGIQDVLSGPQEVQKFEVDAELATEEKRRAIRDALQQRANDLNSRDAATDQLAKMNVLRKD